MVRPPPNRLKLAGRRFGRLVALRVAERAGKSWHRYWWTRCDCGREVMVLGVELARGRSRSCGCLRQEMMLAAPRSADGRLVAAGAVAS